MKALSIRQPWAWMILHGGKDIENRTWKTNFRGRVLIHAAKGMSHAEYFNAMKTNAAIPGFDSNSLWRGGIIGSVEIVDCVQQDKSFWFEGPYGFKLANLKSLPFVPLKGQLGFFEVDPEVLRQETA